MEYDSFLGGVHKLRLQDLAFFDHLPPFLYIFYGIKVYKKSIFLTTYPPPLVNVVCKRPHIFFRVRNLFSFASFESNEKIRFQELKNVWLNGIPNLFRVRIWKQPPIFHNLRNSVALIFFWVHRNKASNAKISRRPFSCCLL